MRFNPNWIFSEPLSADSVSCSTVTLPIAPRAWLLRARKRVRGTAAAIARPSRHARGFGRNHAGREQQQAAYRNGHEASHGTGHDDRAVRGLIAETPARPVQGMHGIDQIVLSVRRDRLSR